MNDWSIVLGLVRPLSDVEAFSSAVLHRQLRPYQLDIARAILPSDEDQAGRSFTIPPSRQTYTSVRPYRSRCWTPVTPTEAVALSQAITLARGGHMVIGVLAAAWLIFTGAFIAGWSRFNAHLRAVEGIDEAAYINGTDERSLAEAA